MLKNILIRLVLSLKAKNWIMESSVYNALCHARSSSWDILSGLHHTGLDFFQIVQYISDIFEYSKKCASIFFFMKQQDYLKKSFYFEIFILLIFYNQNINMVSVTISTVRNTSCFFTFYIITKVRKFFRSLQKQYVYLDILCFRAIISIYKIIKMAKKLRGNWRKMTVHGSTIL